MRKTILSMILIVAILFFTSCSSEKSQKASSPELLEVKTFGDLNFIEIVKGYDEILSITDVGGKPAVFAEKHKKNLIYYDGNELGREYDRISFPIDLNGKLVFVAMKKDKSYIVYDGKQFGSEYDSVGSSMAVGNKLLFVAKKNNKEFLVFDGKELGREYDGLKLPIGIASSSEPIVLNEELVFVAIKNGKKVLYLVQSRLEMVID